MNKILAIGHRGCAGLLPENTLAGFRRAFEMGLDAVEFDVQLTKDGRVVVYHDFCLNPSITRMSNGFWLEKDDIAICQSTLEELRHYKLGQVRQGTKYAQNHPELEDIEDEKIPTLEELFECALNFPKVQLQIEIKTSPEEPSISSKYEELVPRVLSIVEAFEYQDRVAILAFDWAALSLTFKTDPLLPLYFIYEEDYNGTGVERPWFGEHPTHDSRAVPKLIKVMGGQFWSLRHTKLTMGDIAEAHRCGLKVNAWGANSAEEMQRVIDMGVNAITTDRPDVLLDVLGRQ